MTDKANRRKFLSYVACGLTGVVTTELWEAFIPTRYGLQQFFPNSPVELLRRYQDTQKMLEEKEREISKLFKELQECRAQYSQLERSNKQILTEIAEAEVAYNQAVNELERFRQNGIDILASIRELFFENKEN